MPTHRASLFTALLMTAALLCALPGLVRPLSTQDENRMDANLRPARARTLTVWLLSSGMGDQRLLNELCADFEKEREGVRVFVRKADAVELLAPDAVPPAVALYETGVVIAPERLFQPLANLAALPEAAVSAGRSGGVSYAVPLWYAPNVLSLPSPWLASDAPAQSPAPSSFFQLATPAPQAMEGQPQAFLSPDALPWRKLLAPGALARPAGVALQQLLLLCPMPLRQELISALRGEGNASASRAAASASAIQIARVQPLYAHQAALANGEALIACPLLPAVTDGVRYLSLCNDSEDARAFARFLLRSGSQQKAFAWGLLPAADANSAQADALTAELDQRFTAGLYLPNAFAHTRAEMNALCLDAFLRSADPVETLLQLR
ncbi:MAG: hypothetical protein RSB91_07610 [Clostridia bacterium]